MSLRIEVAKNNIIFMAGNIVAALLSFIFSVVVARLLLTEQFGLFSFALVVMGFFTVFIDLGISSTLIRFMVEYIERKEDSRLGSLLCFFFKFRMALTLIVAMIMVTFSEQIAALIFNKSGEGLFITFAAGLLIVTSAFDFLNMVFIGFKNFKNMVVLRLSERILRLVFVVSLVLAGLKAAGAISGIILSSFVVMLVGFIFMRKYWHVFRAKGPAFEKGLLARFGFWVFIGAILSSFYIMTDAIMISILRPIAEVGFYSIALSWMTLVTYIVPISSVVMYPYFSSLKKSRNFDVIASSLKYTLIFMLPIGFIMSGFAVPIITIFYKAPFAPAASALSLLSLVSIFLVTSPLFIGYFYGIGKPKIPAAVITTAFMLNITLNYLMINAFGIWGAAAATLISRIIEAAIFICIITLVMKLGFRWKDMIKPIIASLMIYAIAFMMPISNLLQLVAYGILLLGVYTAIMVAVGGIKRGDISLIFSFLRRRV